MNLRGYYSLQAKQYLFVVVDQQWRHWWLLVSNGDNADERWVLLSHADKPWPLLVTNGGSNDDRWVLVSQAHGCWSAIETVAVIGPATQVSKPCHGWLLVSNGDDVADRLVAGQQCRQQLWWLVAGQRWRQQLWWLVAGNNNCGAWWLAGSGDINVVVVCWPAIFCSPVV